MADSPLPMVGRLGRLNPLCVDAVCIIVRQSPLVGTRHGVSNTLLCSLKQPFLLCETYHPYCTYGFSQSLNLSTKKSLHQLIYILRPVHQAFIKHRFCIK